MNLLSTHWSIPAMCALMGFLAAALQTERKRSLGITLVGCALIGAAYIIGKLGL